MSSNDRTTTNEHFNIGNDEVNSTQGNNQRLQKLTSLGLIQTRLKQPRYLLQGHSRITTIMLKNIPYISILVREPSIFLLDQKTSYIPLSYVPFQQTRSELVFNVITTNIQKYF